MNTFTRNESLRKYLVGGFAALSLAIVAACGGNSSNQPGVPYPAPSNLGSASLSSTSASTITMATTAGLGVGTVALKGSGTVAATQSTTLPSGTVALSRKSLKSSAPKPLASPTSDPNKAIAYVTITASTAATLSAISGVSITPTGTFPAGPYLLAFWNGSQWVTVGNPVASASQGVISFGNTALSPAISLAAGQTLNLVVYTGVTFVTPTPPPPPPVASPSAVTLSLGIDGSIDVTTGANVPVNAISSDPTVVTVDASATADSSGKATFRLVPLKVGTATITFTDQIGQHSTASIIVSNTLPSPNPSPASAIFGQGSSTTLTVKSRPGTLITATSTSSAVLSVSPASAAADSTGAATFIVTAGAAGTATISFADPFGDTGSFSGTVSSITNGAFTVNGSASLTGWTPCSFKYTWPGVVNASPAPLGTPAATPTPTSMPTVAPATVASLARVTPAPLNLEPGNGSFAPNVVGSPIPAAVGSNVAYLGDAASETSGAAGICQTFTPVAAVKYLSFWVYEGGSEYNAGNATQEADVLDSVGSTVLAPLFVEQNCFWDPGTLGATGYLNNGCIPPFYNGTSAYADWQGGYWVQRGPFDLSAYVGTPITLFVGVWDKKTHGSPSSPTTYGNEIFVGNVQTSATATMPTTLPLARKSTMSIQLRRR